MAKGAAALLLIVAAAGAGLYWWLWRPQQQALEAAQQQLAAVQRDAAALRSRVADLEAIRDQLQKAGTELQQQVADKEKELAGLRSTQDELLEGLKQEIANKQIQVERIRDQLRVEMVDEILFDSGEAAIKPAGLEVLRRVGAVLKKTQNRRIEVQGHTDNVPITGALAKRFPTNWELSAARAINVARFLEDEAKLDPQFLSATAYSQFRPRGPNDSEDGRRRNRRIEILLGPVIPADRR